MASTNATTSLRSLNRSFGHELALSQIDSLLCIAVQHLDVPVPTLRRRVGAMLAFLEGTIDDPDEYAPAEPTH
jgi:hypothetical protein